MLIGVAQEKAQAWRGWRDGGNDAHPHFEFGRQAVFVNHYYFYIRDRQWGPSFVKTNAYAPYPVWVWLNGHEWAKRQAAARGLAFEALDNGFRSCPDPEALAGICASLSDGDAHEFFARWMRALPSPLTPGRALPLPLRAVGPPTGGLRHPRVRQARRRPRVV